jgi:hypothetical protein
MFYKQFKDILHFICKEIIMKIIALTFLLFVVSCGKSNSSSSSNISPVTGFNLTTMKNEGIYFSLRRHSFWPDIYWIEIRCTNIIGKTNAHKSQVLLQTVNKSSGIKIGNHRIESWKETRMVNEAFDLLERRPESQRCTNTILSSERDY